MSKKENVRFEIGQKLFIVDCWGFEGGTQAFEVEASVLRVETYKILAMLYGDTYQTYNKKDYGRLIFTTKKEARDEAQRLPKPGTEVYIVGDNKEIVKLTTKGIWYGFFDGATNLIITFKDRDSITTDKIGEVVFLSEVAAQEFVAANK